MLGFISFGGRSCREQSLTMAPPVLAHLVSSTFKAVEALDVDICGCLLPKDTSITLPKDWTLPVLHVCGSGTDVEEFHALTKVATQYSIGEKDWVVIFRPGFGWMSGHRIRTFISHLSVLKGHYAISLRKMSSIQHPLWNIKVVSTDCVKDGAVWQSRGSKYCVSPFREQFPEIWRKLANKDAPPERSQDVKPLHYNDRTLFACRPMATGGRLGLGQPSIFVCPDLAAEEILMCERLPLFDVKAEGCQDPDLLEALLSNLI